MKKLLIFALMAFSVILSGCSNTFKGLSKDWNKIYALTGIKEADDWLQENYW